MTALPSAPAPAAAPRYELKARSASELLDGTFKLYRDQLGPLLALAAITDVPLVLFELLLHRVPSQLAPELSMHALGPVLAVLAMAPVALLAMFVQSCALAAATTDAYQGQLWTVGGVLRRTLGLLPSLVWIGFLVMLALGFGLLFFVVPGIYLGLVWSVWIQVLLVEGKRGGAALGRSRALTRGALGRLGWLLLAFGILQLALLGGMSAAIPAAVEQMPVVGVLLGQVPNVLMAPLYPALLTLVYFDGRIRHEGYDLEVAAREGTGLAPSGGP